MKKGSVNIEAEKPATEDEKKKEIKERRNEETKKPKEATRKGSNNKKDEETTTKEESAEEIRKEQTKQFSSSLPAIYGQLLCSLLAVLVWFVFAVFFEGLFEFCFS